MEEDKIIIDPRAEAMKYIDQHKLRTLFDILGAKLGKEQPESPNDFLVQELLKIAKLKTTGAPVSIFTREDIDTMFSTFDLTNRGYVTQIQYRKALLAVGVEGDNLAAKIPRTDHIDRETFVAEIYAEVLRRAY